MNCGVRQEEEEEEEEEKEKEEEEEEEGANKTWIKCSVDRR